MPLTSLLCFFCATDALFIVRLDTSDSDLEPGLAMNNAQHDVLRTSDIASSATSMLVQSSNARVLSPAQGCSEHVMDSDFPL